MPRSLRTPVPYGYPTTSGYSFYDSDDEGSDASTEETEFSDLSVYDFNDDIPYTPSFCPEQFGKSSSKYTVSMSESLCENNERKSSIATFHLIKERNRDGTNCKGQTKTSNGPVFPQMSSTQGNSILGRLRRFANTMVGSKVKDSTPKTGNAQIARSTQAVREGKSSIIHISTRLKPKTDTNILEAEDVDIGLSHCCRSMGEVQISPVFDVPVTPKQPEGLSPLQSYPSTKRGNLLPPISRKQTNMDKKISISSTEKLSQNLQYGPHKGTKTSGTTNDERRKQEELYARRHSVYVTDRHTALPIRKSSSIINHDDVINSVPKRKLTRSPMKSRNPTGNTNNEKQQRKSDPTVLNISPVCIFSPVEDMISVDTTISTETRFWNTSRQERRSSVFASASQNVNTYVRLPDIESNYTVSQGEMKRQPYDAVKMLGSRLRLDPDRERRMPCRRNAVSHKRQLELGTDDGANDFPILSSLYS